MKKDKREPWEIPVMILWYAGLFSFYHGIGYSREKNVFDFKGGYFVIGILILAPIYLFIRSIKEKEKSFPVENFHKDIVISDIKKYKICEDIDLTASVIESYVFGVGKDQNDYVNIFYNKNDIEFVKTKVTISYFNKSLPDIAAFTNIEAVALKEIFQKYSLTKVYFDKYILTNYYLDLEFLIDLDIQKNTESQRDLKKDFKPI
ncbi:hypothetical protein [Chryseobacterium hagamense]|uniref:Uncharacterized protein n=1 Tax=Chryseobacterium hagamense TaxID=395935 RepID=A0A511YNT4_9FLAO|nr:hypothetical protein [Chryseobacterium hagamense]GEN76855.1 hypothetical protein CHA01nite_25950 [Chryseobacterium hagamense]